MEVYGLPHPAPAEPGGAEKAAEATNPSIRSDSWAGPAQAPGVAARGGGKTPNPRQADLAGRRASKQPEMGLQ